MKKLRVWQIPLLAFTFLLSSPVPLVFPQGFDTVFTKQYTHSGGHPDTLSDSFTACNPTGTFKMTVVNGPGGQRPVSGGSVVLNGVEIIRLQHKTQVIEKPLTNVRRENVLEVQRLRGGPGGAIQVAVEGIQSCRPHITTPAPGSTLTDPIVLVRGEVPAGAGPPIGVSVNGFPALVEGGQFAAFMPVDAQVTQLTATATDFVGTLGSETIPVTVQPSPAEGLVRLRASPSGGLAPLTVGFQLSSLVGVSQVDLDLGNGTMPFQGTSLEGQTFTYSQPGIYSPTVQVTDPQGQVHSAVTIVQVLDQASLDAQLQAVWRGLKDALRSGDVARAVTFIHNDTRSAYQDQLSRFSLTTLTNIDRYVTTIQLVEVGAGGAQYEMLRDRNGQVLSFSVWFQIDQDGLWRVRRF